MIVRRVEYFLIVKLTPAIFEFPDHGQDQSTAVAAGKIEAPLVGLWIVKTQGVFTRFGRGGANHLRGHILSHGISVAAGRLLDCAEVADHGLHGGEVA
jgi:hypothetical protein